MRCLPAPPPLAPPRAVSSVTRPALGVGSGRPRAAVRAALRTDLRPRPPIRLQGDGAPASPEGEGALAIRERRRTQRPRRFKVLLHNDDFTTMEFVIEMLIRHFRKSPSEATRVMLEVHHKGVGVAGVFTLEVAETKVAQVTSAAREQGMPLRCSLEPE